LAHFTFSLYDELYCQKLFFVIVSVSASREICVDRKESTIFICTCYLYGITLIQLFLPDRKNVK